MPWLIVIVISIGVVIGVLVRSGRVVDLGGVVVGLALGLGLADLILVGVILI